MITRIEAYRYRCFEKLDLRLDRFQVFVGPNGAGKTTLLDIPVVLGEMLAARSIEKAFLESTPSHPRPRADYAGDLIYRNVGENFILAVEAKLPPELVSRLVEKQAARLEAKRTRDGVRAVDKLRAHPSSWFTSIRYEIEFELFNGALQIGQEYLMLLADGAHEKRPTSRGLIGEWVTKGSKRIFPVIQRYRGGKIHYRPEVEKRGLRNDYSFPPIEPAFSNVFADRSRYGAALWLRDLLTSGVCAYQPSLQALRNPHRRIRQPNVVRDAATLAWLALELEQPTEVEVADAKPKPKTSRAFESWQRFARLALQGLQRIEPVVREDDKHAYLRLHYRNGAKVPSSGLSDGTLTILAITILPYLSRTPLFLTYEEPENGVHPRGIELLVEALQTIHGSQVLVSSHSPLVLAKCLPHQVICLSIDEKGSAAAVPGNLHPALKDWKKSMNLGTLLAGGDSWMKPLLIMTADSQCAATIRGFFEREKYFLPLGCGLIELAGEKFNPGRDIVVHPGHDPGVWTDPQAILLAAGKIYEKVLIVLDHAWDGAPEPEQLVTDIEEVVQEEAQLGRHRFEVIVICPELEAWIWQRNPHVVSAFGFNGTPKELWALFEQQCLHLDRDGKKHCFAPADALAGRPPAWPMARAKPENPKGLVEALAAHCQSGPPSGIFTEISSTISTARCADPAFHRMRAKLREWFPKQKDTWEE